MASSRPTLARVVLLVLALLLGAAPSVRAQGARREDRGQVSALPGFDVSARADEPPSSVDLRPLLPPVGRQTMNDCAAWAFGYAARSYLEAVDQGWKPNAPERVFSPTFIYNQVCGGEDKGSRIDRVLALLQERGAATLATCPYRAKDFQSPPPDAALAEASTFPILGYFVLQDGAEIRAALAERRIVLCCVRTNPLFSSGRYKQYTPELHAQGRAQRRPGQPHGYHAMAIVGYSDERRAFLFMNSWGTDWGQGGFVWVGYDVLERFNAGDLSEELVDFALTMVDAPGTVARVDGGYRVVQLEDFALRGRFLGADWRPEERAYDYRFETLLDGPRALLDTLASVEWEIESEAGLEVHPARRGVGSYSLFHGLAAPSYVARARIALPDGRSRVLETKVEGQRVPEREVSIERTEAYALGGPGSELFQWRLVPRLSDADWRDLVRIEFQAGAPPGGVEQRVYEHPGGLPGPWTPQSLWTATFLGGPQSAHAFFHFRDGSRVLVRQPGDPFRDDLRAPRLEATWRPEGTDDGRALYFYELRVRYPAFGHEAIRAVVVTLGAGAGQREVLADRVEGPGPPMHVVSGYATRPFQAEAVILYPSFDPAESRPRVERVEPLVVALEPEVAWSDPSGFGIEAEDRYAGLVDGQPTWEHHLRVDGLADLWTLRQVTWTLGERTLTRPDEGEVDWFHPFDVTHRSSEPFEARADCLTQEGERFTLTALVRPRAARNDALIVDLERRASTELAGSAPERRLVRVRVQGPHDERERVRAVELELRRPFGATERVRVETKGFGAPGDTLDALVELVDDQPIDALIHFDDGSALATRVEAHGPTPLPVLPRLVLQARERYHGLVDGAPRWRAELALRGDAGLLEAVEAVEWEARDAAGHPQAVRRVEDPRRAKLETSVPLALVARVRFRPESRLEPLVLESRVATRARRTSDELAIAIEQPWDPRVAWDPNVDPADMEDFGMRPFALRLVGPEARLAAVEAVEWTLPQEWGEAQALVCEERRAPVEGRELEGFALRALVFEEGTQEARAVVRLRGGETLELACTVEESRLRPPVPWPEQRTLDFGATEDGPAYLARLSFPLLEDEYGTTLRVAYALAGEARPAGGGPLSSDESAAFARDFLVRGEASLAAFTRALIPNHGVGFTTVEEDRREVDDVLLRAPALQEARVVLAEDPHGAPAYRIARLELPAGTLARVARVEYELEDEQGTRSVPAERALGPADCVPDGFELGRFETPILGRERPRSLRARLYERDAPAPFLTLELRDE